MSWRYRRARGKDGWSLVGASIHGSWIWACTDIDHRPSALNLATSSKEATFSVFPTQIHTRTPALPETEMARRPYGGGHSGGRWGRRQHMMHGGCASALVGQRPGSHLLQMTGENERSHQAQIRCPAVLHASCPPAVWLNVRSVPRESIKTHILLGTQHGRQRARGSARACAGLPLAIHRRPDGETGLLFWDVPVWKVASHTSRGCRRGCAPVSERLGGRCVHHAGSGLATTNSTRSRWKTRADAHLAYGWIPVAIGEHRAQAPLGRCGLDGAPANHVPRAASGAGLRA